MPDQTDVRPATSSDLPGLQQVARTTWRQTYAGLIPNADITAFLEEAYSLENLASASDALGDGLIVAYQDQTVIGYAQAGANRDGGGELFAIYVLPQYQGTGIGFQLWQSAVDHLASLGFETFIVWVLVSNQQARSFYERQGAVGVEERSFMIGERLVTELGFRAATTFDNDRVGG